MEHSITNQQMKTTVFKEFKFSAAHYLSIKNHPCSKVHGHNYRVVIECSGYRNADGMVIDFHKIKELVGPIIDQLDHQCLNDILTGTTCEYICEWIARQAQNRLGIVSRVTVWETETCGATVIL